MNERIAQSFNITVIDCVWRICDSTSDKLNWPPHIFTGELGILKMWNDLELIFCVKI